MYKGNYGIGTNLRLSIKELLLFLFFVHFILLDFFFSWALLGFFLLSKVNENKQSLLPKWMN